MANIYNTLYSTFEFIVLVTQLCLTLCDPMDHSLPGSSVHGILQARILEWVAISFYIWIHYQVHFHTITLIL